MTSEPREGHFRVCFVGKRESVVVRGRFHPIRACQKCLPVGLKVEGNIDRHSIKRRSGSCTQRDGGKNKHTNYRSHSFLLLIKHLESLNTSTLSLFRFSKKKTAPVAKIGFGRRANSIAAQRSSTVGRAHTAAFL